jgi:hypothetical protein
LGTDELPQSLQVHQHGIVHYLHHFVAAIWERASSKWFLAFVDFVEFVADGSEMLEQWLTADFSRLVLAPERAGYGESAWAVACRSGVGIDYQRCVKEARVAAESAHVVAL